MYDDMIVITTVQDHSPQIGNTKTVLFQGISWQGQSYFPKKVAGPSHRNYRPAIAISENDDIVVVWENFSHPITMSQIEARGFDKEGIENIAQLTVNTKAEHIQRYPDVACAANGDFVVVWEDDNYGNGYYRVRARGFFKDGIEKFPEFTVNKTDTSKQLPLPNAPKPKIIKKSKERPFDKNDIPPQHLPPFEHWPESNLWNDGPKTVEIPDYGQELRPAITQMPDGTFYIVWVNKDNDNDSCQIHLRGYNADGNSFTDIIEVCSDAKGQKRRPRIASNSEYIVVTWMDWRTGEPQVRAKVFNKNCSSISEDKVVSLQTQGNFGSPDVGMDNSGRFIIVWSNEHNATSDIFARGFSRSGQEFIAQFQVNPNSSKYQSNARIAVAQTGEFAILWTHDSNTEDSVNYNPEVFARFYDPHGNKTYPPDGMDIPDRTGEDVNAQELFGESRNMQPAIAITNVKKSKFIIAEKVKTFHAIIE